MERLDLTPSRIMHYIVDGEFENAKDYTYIICGKSVPTGKTWLWNGLNLHSFKAIEISEYILGLVDYRDERNHFIVNGKDRSVLIILNRLLHD